MRVRVIECVLGCLLRWTGNDRRTQRSVGWQACDFLPLRAPMTDVEYAKVVQPTVHYREHAVGSSNFEDFPRGSSAASAPIGAVVPLARVPGERDRRLRG